MMESISHQERVSLITCDVIRAVAPRLQRPPTRKAKHAAGRYGTQLGSRCARGRW